MAAIFALALVACGGVSAPTVERTPRPDATPRATSAAPLPASPKASRGLPVTGAELADAVGWTEILPHLQELQRIADANGGNRATGSPGHSASLAYVEERLVDAGYDVQRHVFSWDGGEGTNLITERRGAAGSGVVILGAHLDSVPAGPGINDNASGVGTLLALAEALGAVERPHRTVRFAFWDAEEPGLHGSRAYVDTLDASRRGGIEAYLNFDVLGSPNHIRFVYDESGSAAGSDVLTDIFVEHFDGAGLAWEPIDLTGHADHGPFIAAGIPTGGLFAGGHEPKTDAQAAAFGGSSGEPADPCSHRACDTIDNVSRGAVDEMADAAAHALAVLAAGRDVRPGE